MIIDILLLFTFKHDAKAISRVCSRLKCDVLQLKLNVLYLILSLYALELTNLFLLDNFC